MKNLVKINILEKIFHQLKKFFSGSRKSYLGIFLLISGLCSIDLALNSYSSVHQLCFSMGDIVRTILLWILLLFSFVLLGGKYIRIPFMFLVVWMLTIDFLEIFMLYNFHHLLSGEVIFIFLSALGMK